MSTKTGTTDRVSSSSIQRGEVEAIVENGGYLVVVAAECEPLVCDRLETAPPARLPAVGDQVLVARVDNSETRGVILGVIATPGQVTNRTWLTLGVVGDVADGAVTVRVREFDRPLPATRLPAWTPAQIDRLQQAGETLLLRIDEAAGAAPTAEIVGIAAPASAEPAALDASRLFLDVKDEIILRTKRSMIAIRANGEIEIVGTRVVTRARELNKVVAPMIELN